MDSAPVHFIRNDGTLGTVGGEQSPPAEREDDGLFAYFVDGMMASEAGEYLMKVEDLPPAERLRLRGGCGLKVLFAQMMGRQRLARGGNVIEVDGKHFPFAGIQAGVLKGARLNHQEALFVRHRRVTAELPFWINTAIHAEGDLDAAAALADVQWQRHQHLYDCPLYVEVRT